MNLFSFFFPSKNLPSDRILTSESLELLENLKLVSKKLHDERKALEETLNNINAVKLTNKVIELNEVKNFTNNILENISNPIITVNLEGRITFINKSFRETLGFKLDDIKGLLYEDVFSKNSCEHFLMETLRTGKCFSLEEIVLKSKDGKSVNMLITSSILKDNRDKMIGVIGNFKDISEIKVIQEKINLSGKYSPVGEMVAWMSHGIKNPLSIISGYIQLLPERFHDLDFRKNFSVIVNSELNKLNMLARTLIDFGQVVTIQDDNVDINEIIKQNLLFTKEISQKNNIEVKAEYETQLPKIKSSYIHINQACLDIILNAYQSMLSGGILEIKTRKINGFVEIIIKDNGCGIPIENIEKIFKPFFTTRNDCIGLGLSIAQKTIETFGGQIKVSSEFGKGSTFTVLLPYL